MCDVSYADYAKDTRVAAAVVRVCTRVHASNVYSERKCSVAHWRDIIGKEWPCRYTRRRVSRFMPGIIFMYATREGLR